MNPTTPTPLPWPGSRHEYSETEVSFGLAELLTAVIVYIRKYIVVTDYQAVAIVLWAAHTPRSTLLTAHRTCRSRARRSGPERRGLSRCSSR
jgi:hypothetical protein